MAVILYSDDIKVAHPVAHYPLKCETVIDILAELTLPRQAHLSCCRVAAG